MNNNEIIIANFQEGIGQSPLLGFGNMRNLDVTTNPGTARINNIPVKVSGTTVTNQIVGYVIDPVVSNNIYALDTASVCYKSTDSGASWSVLAGNTAGTGMGIGIWKGYLFVVRTNAIDVYGPLISSPSWSNSWQSPGSGTTVSGVFAPVLSSLDDKFYIGFGQHVICITELTTFAPGTGASYSYNATAITIPSSSVVRALVDLGSTLLIGTSALAVSVFKVADIYPYLRAPSGSSLTLGLPIRLQENGVYAMQTVGNLTYVVAGTSGKLYVTDGVSIVEKARVPNSIINLDGGAYIESAVNSIMHHQGKIYWGVNSGSTSGLSNLGVWSYNPKTNALQIENIISTGNEGISNTLKVSALISISRDQYLIGWQDNTTYGIDKIDNTKRYTSYSAFLESQLYQVGESVNQRTIQSVEIYFQKPLTTGQGATLYYRKDLTSAYTLFGTVDYATYGGTMAQSIPAGVITNADFVQFKCVLTCDATLNISPELVKLIIKLSN